MSNERCVQCSEGYHDECPWAAGMCPVCGPAGCLTFLGPILDEIPRGFCGRSEVHPGHGQCDGFTEADRLTLDAALYGNAYTLDGKRVPPEDVVVHEAPTGTVHTQEEFLTALDILLDHTLHADECYCDPNDTVCVCVIGKVRAALPPCGASSTLGGRRVYSCTRNAHPASPDRHTFG